MCVYFLFLFGIFNHLIGCSSSGGGGSFLAPAERSLATGDWDDVRAAVEAGARAAEMAVVSSNESTDGRTKTYQLVTVTDEPARVVAHVRGGAGMSGGKAWGAAGGAGPIEISASVGRFGDVQRERKLLKAIRQRLEQLSGVDSAPLPDDVRDLLR